MVSFGNDEDNTFFAEGVTYQVSDMMVFRDVEGTPSHEERKPKRANMASAFTALEYAQRARLQGGSRGRSVTRTTMRHWGQAVGGSSSEPDPALGSIAVAHPSTTNGLGKETASTSSGPLRKERT